MGAVGGKEAVQAVQLVVQSLPTLITAFQATKSNEKNNEDEKIAQVLELLQQDRRDINQVIQNQGRLEEGYQALALLMNRVEDCGPEQRQRRGADGQRAKIRIEMDLPDNVEERERAMRTFWQTLRRVGSNYEQEQGNCLAIDPEDRDVVRHESQALASAPPFHSDEAESEGHTPEVNPMLCCEVCTQPYDNGERRPTLLPDCGHTFCKECLIKSRRRNRSCPTCRKYCKEDVDKLPTNYSILDIINDYAKKCKTSCGSFDDDDVDECRRKGNTNSNNCNRRENCSDLESDMSFEEQLQIARLMSLEDYQKQQLDEDSRLAQQLQEEEERLMRFSQHEDHSRKRQIHGPDDLERGRSRTAARRQTPSDESPRRNSNRCSGACYDEEEASRGARRKSYHSDQSCDDDDEVSCPHLSSEGGIYGEAREKLPEPGNKGDSSYEKSYSDVSSQDRLDEGDGFQDGYIINSRREIPLPESHRQNQDEEAPKKGKEELSDDDDDDDCCHPSSKRGLYTSAREELDDCIMEGENDDDGYCKNSATTKEDDLCEEDGYAREMDAMLIRAISTHEEDKEKRRKRKYLREQEELEFALALSLSIMPQQQEGQVG